MPEQQDMFCFLIDPNGWTDIGGELFAPGFFVWNSEVGRRTVGISTFWYQSICGNHIVWDAVEVTEITRRHIAECATPLAQIRQAIEQLAKKRDERKDRFAKVVAKAMQTPYGQDREQTQRLLSPGQVYAAPCPKGNRHCPPNPEAFQSGRW